MFLNRLLCSIYKMWMKNEGKCLDSHPDYSYDEACLDIYNLYHDSVDIYSQYVECDNCDYQLKVSLDGQRMTSLLVNTKYSIRMYYKHNESILCPWDKGLLEHYRYRWNLTDTCDPLYIKEEADNAYIPIFTAYIILMFIGTMWYMVKCIYKCTRNNNLWRRFIWRSTEIENDLGSTSESLVLERSPIKKHPKRLKSIDIFRGFCILLMIFVDNGGGEYWFFKHTNWNGMTFADLVFPWFTWIMGVSMTMAITTKLRQATPRRQLICQVIKRSVILILLGLLLNSHNRNDLLSELRFTGVLQRLGLCYLIVGLLEATFAKRSPNEYRNGWFIPEIISSWPQWLVMISLVIIHTCIIFFVSVPGCGRGYLGPGGLHDHGKFANCTGGITGYIDRAVLGDHIYKHSTNKIYETTLPFDPEGILGTLTAAFLVFLGVHAGRIMVTYGSTKNKIIRLLITGFVLCLIGASLCDFSKNGGIIPINKRLSSLSFVTVLGGFATFIFAFLHVFVDVAGKWGGRPFFYPGMNPLILYACHILFRQTIPFSWKVSTETHAALLAINLWTTIIWLCVSIWMYKNDIFVSI